MTKVENFSMVNGHLKKALLTLLQDNIITFEYEKSDGTIRIIRGTLIESYIPIYEKKTDRTKNTSDDNIVVVDVEAGEFRSLKLNMIRHFEI